MHSHSNLVPRASLFSYVIRGELLESTLDLAINLRTPSGPGLSAVIVLYIITAVIVVGLRYGE